MKQNNRKKSSFRIHEIYRLREDFLYDNPMNIYLSNNRKTAILTFINANRGEITLLPRKMKDVVLERPVRRTFSLYKHGNSTEYIVYRRLRNLEMQRKIDTFKIHTLFKDTIEESTCMTISAGFRKILQRKIIAMQANRNR